MKVIKFIFLFTIASYVINFITCSCQNGTLVSKVEDCVSGESEKTYCCMLSSPGAVPTTQMCINISKDQFVGQTTYMYDGNKWKINCGNATFTPVEGGVCGNSDPLSAYDCWTFSTDQDSCCFYLKNNNTVTGRNCQWYGSKFSGNITKEGTGLSLMCTGDNNKFSLITLLVSILVLAFS